jgi:FkbM family methyltransferase
MHVEHLSEPQCLNEYLKISKSFNPTLSIEVGAHRAEYSQAMSEIGIKSIAFEASPAVYNKFKDSISGFDYINMAMSDYAGTILFNIESSSNPADVGHNSIKGFNLPWRINGDPVEVSCSTLDLYFNDLQDEKISMWIDVEGANKEVLLGATRLLKNVKTIYIEVEHIDFWIDQWKRQDVIDFLDANGFDLYREFAAYSNQTNCIFIKR